MSADNDVEESEGSEPAPEQEASAPSEDEQEMAANAVDAAYSIRQVNNQSGLLPVQSPYRFSVQKQGDQYELTGFAPDTKTKTALENAVLEAVSAHTRIVLSRPAEARRLLSGDQCTLKTTLSCPVYCCVSFPFFASQIRTIFR